MSKVSKRLIVGRDAYAVARWWREDRKGGAISVPYLMYILSKMHDKPYTLGFFRYAMRGMAEVKPHCIREGIHSPILDAWCSENRFPEFYISLCGDVEEQVVSATTTYQSDFNYEIKHGMYNMDRQFSMILNDEDPPREDEKMLEMIDEYAEGWGECVAKNLPCVEYISDCLDHPVPNRVPANESAVKQAIGWANRHKEELKIGCTC